MRSSETVCPISDTVGVVINEILRKNSYHRKGDLIAEDEGRSHLWKEILVRLRSFEKTHGELPSNLPGYCHKFLPRIAQSFFGERARWGGCGSGRSNMKPSDFCEFGPDCEHLVWGREKMTSIRAAAERAQDADLFEKLNRILAILPVHQRESLWAQGRFGGSTRAIGEVMRKYDCSPATVYNWAEIAFGRLRDCLAPGPLSGNG